MPEPLADFCELDVKPLSNVGIDFSTGSMKSRPVPKIKNSDGCDGFVVDGGK